LTRQLRNLALLSLGLFSLLILWLTYLQAWNSEKLSYHPLNPRLSLIEERVKRGAIYDCKGNVLAQSSGRAGAYQRHYPLGEAAAPVIGYVSTRYGTSGVEACYSGELLGLKGFRSIRNQVYRLLGRPLEGDHLTLTLDARLQEVGYSLLGGRRGAIVVLDPRTGAVLALVSSPSFDPNRLEEKWEELNQPQAQSPLLNRALQGLYPPGSTMKLVTATAVLQKDPGAAQRTYHCPGYLKIGGWKLTCPYAHGRVDFQEAMMYSCNVTFASLALEVGGKAFVETACSYGFNENLPFDLPVKVSKIPASLEGGLLAQAAIGQGEVLASPFQMALVTAAIANKGVIMRPYLVERVGSGGLVENSFIPRPWKTVCSAQVADTIKEAMVATARAGTATGVNLPGVEVAAKTGTAQNPQGDPHAWMVAFAPADNPRVVVAVIVENAGSGGVVAAPIARKMLELALGR